MRQTRRSSQCLARSTATTSTSRAACQRLTWRTWCVLVLLLPARAPSAPEPSVVQERQRLSGPDVLPAALSRTSSFVASRSAEAGASDKPGSQRVGRIALQSLLDPAYLSPGQAGPGLSRMQPQQLLGGPDWSTGQQLLRFVQSLRRELFGSCCAAVLTLAPGVHLLCVCKTPMDLADNLSCGAGSLDSSSLVRLQHLCDAVLSFEALTDDAPVVRLAPDPGRQADAANPVLQASGFKLTGCVGCSCACLLNVVKLPGLNSAVCPLPRISQFMVRQHRRHLAIDVVEVDPDAEAGPAAPSAAGLDF